MRGHRRRAMVELPVTWGGKDRRIGVVLQFVERVPRVCVIFLSLTVADDFQALCRAHLHCSRCRCGSGLEEGRRGHVGVFKINSHSRPKQTSEQERSKSKDKM
jgi:hypothetical protein